MLGIEFSMLGIDLLGSKTDNGGNARMHETNTYANAMHMMT